MPAKRDRQTELRVVLAEGDSERLLDVLDQGWPGDALQLVGDALGRGAIAGPAARGSALARRCASELRSRDWEGDVELAETLEARLGIGPVRLLRPIPVDLEELSMVLEGDPVNGGGRIDLRTGEVWPAAAIEYAQDSGDLDEDDDEDDDRWLWVTSEGSRGGYRDMELFTALLEDADLVARLERALVGRGVFRRFKDVLAESPTDLQRWYAFSDERQRGRARAWLAAEGYATTA